MRDSLFQKVLPTGRRECEVREPSLGGGKLRRKVWSLGKTETGEEGVS